jgi:hypothetical protein
MMLRVRKGACGAAMLLALIGGRVLAQEAPAANPAPAGADGMSADAAPTPPPPPAEAPPPAPASEQTLSDAIAGGKLILENRTRYEHVDQAKIASPADAGTARTRLGWETADFHGFKGLLEFDNVFHLDDGHYNVAVPGPGGVSLNGKTQYPIVNDPRETSLNRGQITWTPSAMFQFTAGRQRILIDDQRFIGNVGWRQHEQTFDSVRADFTYGRLKASYAYLFRVNRIFGSQLNWNSDSHLFNVGYAIAEPLRLEGFVYALDFTNSTANSSLTYGVRATGKAWVSLVQLTYDGTWARQQDWRGRTKPFQLDYWQADLAGAFDIFTLKADYEQLNGNGVRGFTTPLATTHGFQGWADAFAVAGNKTHVDGIRDINVAFIVRPRWKWTYLYNLEGLARYYDFATQTNGAHLGHEWDAQIQAQVTPKLTVAVKYADFQAAASVPVGTVAPPASRTKVWVTFEYKL